MATDKPKRKRRTKAEIQLDNILKLKNLGFNVSDVQIGVLRQQIWVAQGVHSRLQCPKCKEIITLHLPARVECCGRQAKVLWKNALWAAQSEPLEEDALS